MPNFVSNFDEFLNESALFEGTMLKNKQLDAKEQTKFNQLKTEFLKKQIDLCKKHGVKCFLEYGTLLGFYREGDHIKNDNDTDLGIIGSTVTQEFLEDIEKEFLLLRPKNMKGVIKDMFTNEKGGNDYHEIPYIGIAYKNSKGQPYSVKSVTGKNINVVGDLFFYYPYTNNKFITRWPGWEVQLTPDNYFKRLSKLKIGGYEYPIPSKANEYLEYIYGKDWKTPKSRAGVNQKLEFISREEGQSYAYSHSQKDFKKK